MTTWMPNSDDGLLHQIWHVLGRLEEGQKLNRQSAEERVTTLRVEIRDQICDLKESLSGRIDELENNQHRNPPWWKDLPWKHMATLAAGAYLAIHGHFTAVEIKAIFLKMIGL